jgi:hypothetical protein
MLTKDITVTLPEPLYEHLRKQAEQSNHSIEQELLAIVKQVAPTATGLPRDLEQMLNDLEGLDDKALWRVARVRFPNRSSRQTERLNRKRRNEGLTEEEEATLHKLLHRQDEIMLMRSQAAVLLKERGHDITELGPSR